MCNVAIRAGEAISNRFCVPDTELMYVCRCHRSRDFALSLANALYVKRKTREKVARRGCTLVDAFFSLSLEGSSIEYIRVVGYSANVPRKLTGRERQSVISSFGREILDNVTKGCCKHCRRRFMIDGRGKRNSWCPSSRWSAIRFPG